MTAVNLNSAQAASQLAAIVESSGDAIITKDLNGIITSWNRSAQELFGYTAAEATGQPVTILIPPDRLNEEPSIIERIRRGEKIDHYETVRRHKGGRMLNISLTVSPLFDESGSIVGASKIARDITRRRRAEAEMVKLAAIVESSNDAIITKDLSGIITSWNRGATRMFGYTPAEAIGKPVTMLIPEDRINEEPGILERIGRGEKVDHYETVRKTKDGRLLDISLNVSPVVDADGVIVGASKIARNITGQKEAEAAIRRSEIMSRLVAVQEAERQRIARDLHDHLGQQMTALRLTIESLVRKSVDHPPLRDEIDTLRSLASLMDNDIGFLAWSLSPTVLTELGLDAALDNFIREWSEHHAVEAEYSCDLTQSDRDGGRLPEPVETNLYRIVQEALNNIIKHANARRVTVLLHRRDDHVVLSIEDDGAGFGPTGPAGGKKFSGLGLQGMSERASLLNGTVTVESEKGRGTTILVRIPLR